MATTRIYCRWTIPRLGATIGTGASLDRTGFTLGALTPNLSPSIELLADVVRNPKFDPSEVERLRGQQLAAISAEFNNPSAIASRTLWPVLFDAAHPYGVPPSGLGDPTAVGKVTRDELAAYERLPDKYTSMTAADIDAAGRAKIDVSKLTYVIVGDASVVKPQLDQLKLPIEVVPAPAMGK